MDNQKYRILYNNEMVISVLEDQGTTFLGDDTGLKILVDTLENAKTTLEAIGVNTRRLFDNGNMSEPVESPTGIDYLDEINRSVDPTGVLGDIV
jgi:hypothetical protein